MKIKALKLRRFRNLSELRWEPSPGVNFIVGSNGQGKTSLLEAISLLATLRSFRGAKADEMVQLQSPFGEISADVNEDSNADSPVFQLKVAFSREPGGKTARSVFLNGKIYKSTSQYLVKRFGDYSFAFHSIAFNPSDHDLVRLDPATRRQFLDRSIAAQDPSHLLVTQKYQRLLEHRSNWLRQWGGPGGVRRVPSTQLESFRVFTEGLIETGSEIALKRDQYIRRIRPHLRKALKVIAPSQEEVGLELNSKWLDRPESSSTSETPKTDLEQGLIPAPREHFTRHSVGPSLDLFKVIYREKLREAEDLEIHQKVNLVGPHRDDWELLLGGIPLKSKGSQGEVRSALLALKIAEIELFRESTGHRPVLLLDDFSSELDQQRRMFLLEFLANTDLQVFVTTTEEAFTVGNKIVIREGQIRS